VKEAVYIETVHQIEQKLYRIAKRLLISHEEAQDATQEVLVKVWQKSSELSHVKSIEAYAMTMVKNYCYDRLKSKQASNMSIEYSIHDKSQDQSAAFEAKDRLSFVEKIVNNLPEKQKLIWQLRDVEGATFEEIAEVVQMEPTAIRVNLSRARKRIKESLEQIDAYGI
jgi:RNA polymerase sigma factor (sigma-70 family)